MNLLEAGTKAPDFETVDQDGKKVSLSDYRSKKIIWINELPFNR